MFCFASSSSKAGVVVAAIKRAIVSIVKLLCSFGLSEWETCKVYFPLDIVPAASVLCV